MYYVKYFCWTMHQQVIVMQELISDIGVMSKMKQANKPE